MVVPPIRSPAIIQHPLLQRKPPARIQVYLVCLVHMVHLVGLVQATKRDKPNNGLLPPMNLSSLRGVVVRLDRDG
jgi:hypothetical protein